MSSVITLSDQLKSAAALSLQVFFALQCFFCENFSWIFGFAITLALKVLYPRIL